MTKEEHAKVLAALEAITKHFSISRLHESTLADTTVRGQAHEAIAIMRKEPEPPTVKESLTVPVVKQSLTTEPISDARNFPHNTCPASRHAQIIGEMLIQKKSYPMLHEEPEHCGETILSVVTSLYLARTEIEKLKKKLLRGKEERAKVLAALNIGRIVAQDDDGNYTREITPKRITEAIAIMRKEPEPTNPRHPQYVDGFKAGHAAGRLRGRAEKKEPEPISDAEIFKLADEYCAATWVEMLDEGFSFEKSDLIKFIRALLEKAR